MISICHILWQSLYNLGARRFDIVGIGPIRCCPLERALGTGECKKEMNGLAQAFFNATEILLLYLTSQVQDMKHSLGNLYEITSEVLDNPKAGGFKEAQTGCCGNGSYNAESACNVDAKPCPNRREYVF
ncbi:GDSL LIPASE/ACYLHYDROLASE FAMILY PROTEIN [Salix viminalis]|uniref:GDSL LIPASE/ACYLHYDROLASE FAMILY PROTEIN n=1 Tax=Salix viminalis TaxID=40686 RepID=A0A9Q0ZJH3_SALVM|nr:GDSL LIPASE/ACYLHYDROLASE FAMILY PROTEIN [Salix viminalis]